LIFSKILILIFLTFSCEKIKILPQEEVAYYRFTYQDAQRLLPYKEEYDF